jgi:hypothetical protein
MMEYRAVVCVEIVVELSQWMKLYGVVVGEFLTLMEWGSTEVSYLSR